MMRFHSIILLSLVLMAPGSATNTPSTANLRTPKAAAEASDHESHQRMLWKLKIFNGIRSITNPEPTKAPPAPIPTQSPTTSPTDVAASAQTSDHESHQRMLWNPFKPNKKPPVVTNPGSPSSPDVDCISGDGSSVSEVCNELGFGCCIGEDACEFDYATICKDSCLGEKSCMNIGTITVNEGSCTDDISCFGRTTNVSSNSCNEVGECASDDPTVCEPSSICGGPENGIAQCTDSLTCDGVTYVVDEYEHDTTP